MNQLLVSNLDQINPVHTLIHHVLRFNFNIISPHQRLDTEKVVSSNNDLQLYSGGEGF
jgi:hypothetical protein